MGSGTASISSAVRPLFKTNVTSFLTSSSLEVHQLTWVFSFLITKSVVLFCNLLRPLSYIQEWELGVLWLEARSRIQWLLWRRELTRWLRKAQATVCGRSTLSPTETSPTQSLEPMWLELLILNSLTSGFPLISEEWLKRPELSVFSLKHSRATRLHSALKHPKASLSDCGTNWPLTRLQLCSWRTQTTSKFERTQRAITEWLSSSTTLIKAITSSQFRVCLLWGSGTL